MVTKLRLEPNHGNRGKLTELFFSEEPSIEFRKYLARTVLHIPGYVHPYNEKAQELQDKVIDTWPADFKSIAKIIHPTLISVAKNDRVTKPEASFDLHHHIVNSKLISYPTGGHFFMHYYPRELADEIIKFFS